MITPSDIADAIQVQIEKIFPGEPVYRDLTPSGFQRPSTLIMYSEGTCHLNFGCGLIEMRPEFTLTGFVPVDEYHHSHLEILNQRQMRLLSIFLPSYLRVGDRAPKVANEIELDGGYDFTALIVPMTYTLDQAEFMELQRHETMDALHMKTEVTTDG